MKKFVVPSSLAALLLVVVVLFWLKSVPNRASTPDVVPKTDILKSVPDPANTPAVPKTDIVVHMPQPNELIKSPLEVKGEARGTWFFEANLRVNLLDANGGIVVATYGTAEGEWMTNDFVPFGSVVEFQPPVTETGILRILNDNPSGLPENERHFDVPVRFEAHAQETTRVKVFFGNERFNRGDSPEFDCRAVYPVQRLIPKTLKVAEAAITELLKGPSETEREGGYYTNIPRGVILQKVFLENGILYVDFNTKLGEGGGSCHMAALDSEITATGRQFSTVKEVKISINGRTEDILQP